MLILALGFACPLASVNLTRWSKQVENAQEVYVAAKIIGAKMPLGKRVVVKQGSRLIPFKHHQACITEAFIMTVV